MEGNIAIAVVDWLIFSTQLMKISYLRIITLSFVSAVLFFAACSKKPTILVATMETNHGTVVLELFEEATPLTVENFVGLAEGTKTWTAMDGTEKNEPFYDGLTFTVLSRTS